MPRSAPMSVRPTPRELIMTENQDGFMSSVIREAVAGRISRRMFVERAMAGAMTVAAASSMWSTRVEAATPKQGGTFRVGLHDSNTSDTMDPALVASEFSTQVALAHRNCLTELEADGSVQGDLAESWEASAGADVWTFHLRKGVTFHSGKSLTATDVVDSLNYHRAEDSKSGGKALLAGITDISADGETTVRITMESGNADLPHTMSQFQFQICPSNGDGTIDIAGDGTGAYKIESFNPGIKAVLSKNPDYFKAGRGHFDGVEFIGINDPSARQSALVTNSVDAISDVDLKTAHLLAQEPDIIVDEVASGAHATVPMFMNTAPFDNNDVRLALKYAIDRQACINNAMRGHASIGNDHPIAPTLPYYSEIEQREYDPDKAKHHLNKAGMSGLSVELSAADAAFSGAVDMAVVYAESAKKAGIDIKVIREPNDGYWSNVWMNKPFSVSTWSARPTPDVMFTIAYKSGADWNESFFSNERFDMLLAEAKGELNDDRRREIYRDMMLIMRDEGSTVIPFFRNRVSGRRSTVMHDGMLAGNAPLDGNRATERWWFA